MRVVRSVVVRFESGGRSGDRFPEADLASRISLDDPLLPFGVAQRTPAMQRVRSLAVIRPAHGLRTIAVIEPPILQRGQRPVFVFKVLLT